MINQSILGGYYDNWSPGQPGVGYHNSWTGVPDYAKRYAHYLGLLSNPQSLENIVRTVNVMQSSAPQVELQNLARDYAPPTTNEIPERIVQNMIERQVSIPRAWRERLMQPTTEEIEQPTEESTLPPSSTVPSSSGGGGGKRRSVSNYNSSSSPSKNPGYNPYTSSGFGGSTSPSSSPTGGASISPTNSSGFGANAQRLVANQAAARNTNMYNAGLMW